MSSVYANSHFIDLRDIPADVLRHILDTAKKWKAARRGLPKGAIDEGAPLKDHTLAMVFEKSSTRTRISFEMAMHQLGGKTVVLQGDNMQLGRGESVSDTARVMSSYVDAVMIRANSHTSVLELAEKGSVPVVNALTNRSHPCQLMADMLTLEEHLGDLKGKKVAWIGDGNNVATSLIEAAVKFEFNLSLACPAELSPDSETLEWAEAEGGNVSVTTDPEAAAQDSVAIFTDTWVSMGDEDTDFRLKTLEPYQVNAHLMAQAAPEAIFLHCLPAHRGEEVTADV
ncbi:MAG: ornithine carbamoyltransferase, partial [Kordiimonas sp.]